MTTDDLRVLSVPVHHSYVDEVTPDGSGVHRLADPADHPWAPSPALDPSWLDRHAHGLDVLHVHFGFDASPPEVLRRAVAVLRRCGVPLVLTVHDLRNPHHADPSVHDAQLDVLVPAADLVLTLTRAAAEQVRARWRRQAVVVPHPQVVPDAWLTCPRPPHDGIVVGLHLKGLRPNLAPRPLLAQLLPLVDARPDVRLRVTVHREVLSDGFPRPDPGLLDLLQSAHRAGRLELVVHDRWDDDALYEHLLGVDLSVLPYAWGTHSGWVEACYDLGTTVLAPDHGSWGQQQTLLTYRTADGVPDRDDLARALDLVRSGGGRWRADPTARSAGTARVREQHRALYLDLARLRSATVRA